MTTQVLGFGWAGLFRKYLVEPGEMWWPSNLVQVSLFRALHDKDKRLKVEGTCGSKPKHYNASLQLPWWGVLLACGIALFFTLPIGIITATTNQQPGLNVITEYVIDSTTSNVHGSGGGNRCSSICIHDNCLVADGGDPPSL
ncbi:hypothetical protein Q3G72_025262 [Acer saccharum]|nr:hypothetical protein Q3G72_025262 [Acer saccharum]